MADQLTPEQIAEIFEQYRKSQQSVEEAQKQFGRTLGQSAVQLSSSLYKGAKGVGEFGNAIESAATALSALLLVIPGIGIAVKLAAAAITALGKGINAAAKQGDALFKSYQDLSRAGATAADGITGVFDNMQKLGYGIDELDKMVQLVAQNSATLAKFSLTAADGAQAFANGMAEIQRDGQLRLLGKTTDDINSAGAAFIRQQTMMGRRQFDVQGQLGERTRAYILELDRLQRLTGTSADTLQKQQEEMLSEDAFNVYMEMLTEQGEAGKAQIQKIKDVSALLPAEYQKLVAQSIGGNVEAQRQLFYLAPNLIKDLQDPIKSTADTTRTLNQDLKNFKGVFAKNYLIDPTMREFAGRVVDINEAIAQTSDIDARNKAAAAGAQVQDQATKNLSLASIANMNTRDALQSMVQLGVAPATAALAGLARAAGAVTTTGANAIGAPGAGGSRGLFSGAGARAAGDDVDRILSTIRQRESTNNYGAQSPSSSASGAYQFIDSTWQSLTKKFGTGQEYTSAKMAPKDIQDAIARRYVEDILKRAGGDVSKVPLEWYTGNQQGSMSPEALRRNNGLTAEMYQSKFMKEFQNQPASATQQQAATEENNSLLKRILDSFDIQARLQREQRDLQQKQLQVSQ